MLINKLNSLFDEVAWNSDSAFRSSIYKIDTTFVSRGSLSGFDTKDYFEITPSIGAYQLVVTTEGVNSPLVFSSAITVKITDQFGNILLTEDALGPDIYTDSISFTSSTSGVTYYVEIGSSVNVNYRATLNLINITNSPPVVANAIPDQSSPEDLAWNYQVPSNTFFDANGDVLLYTAAQSNGAALPSWLSFDAATRTFSGTPPKDQFGFIDLTVYAGDGLAIVSDTFRLSVLPVNDAPTALNDTMSVFKNSSATVLVLQNDSDVDNDALSITGVTQPAHGTAIVNGNNTVTYTPAAGYVGPDAFSYTVSDGHGGTATASASVQVTPVPDGTGLRLITTNGLAATLAGNGTTFGTNGFQDLTIPNLPASIVLDGSFSRGGDVLRLPGNASSYSVLASGSFAVLTDGDTTVSVPIGTAGMAVSFADGVRTLLFDLALSSPRIGNEIFGTSALAVTAPPDGTPLPTGVDANATGRLIYTTANDATFSGKASVFGSNAAEHLTLLGGAISLDGSFGRGGDTLTLGSAPNAFSAYLSGSFLVLTSSNATASIPIGTAGILLDFPGTDDRLLRFDVQSGTVKIGTQTITATTAVGAETLDSVQSSAAGTESFVSLEHFSFA